MTPEYLDILQRCLDLNDDTRTSAQDLLDDPWFKIENIRQKAYDEEKRQFKAKILAKVPIIKKSNHTICILAQNNKNEKKEDATEKLCLKKKEGLPTLQIISSNDKLLNKEAEESFPYNNHKPSNKQELVISDYGFQMTNDKEKEMKERQGFLNAREPYINNKVNNAQQNDTANGAIVLSYGAAVAPQIQINNICNLNLINPSNVKKKLNHEAYQAYYNTSSNQQQFALAAMNGMNLLNIQSSPMAMPAASHAHKQGAGGTPVNPVNKASNSSISNVYGQDQMYQPQNPGKINKTTKNPQSTNTSGSRNRAVGSDPSPPIQARSTAGGVSHHSNSNSMD